MSQPEIVFVLGMGRSGTSAITRVLSLCGAALPLPVYGADERNPRGFWEPVRAVKLNDSFLLSNDITRADPTIHAWNVLLPSPSVRASFILQIQEFLTQCPRESVIVIKDPRIAELTEFWLEAARREGMPTKVIIAVRDPCDVATSLDRKTETLRPIFSLWMKRNLLAELQTRSVPRVFVDLSNILNDWRREVTRISNRLSLQLTMSRSREVESFLAPNRYRQQHATSAPDLLWDPWLTALYVLLLESTRDNEALPKMFDRLYEDYQRSEAYDDAKRKWQSFRRGIDIERLKTEMETYYPPMWNSTADFPQD